MKSKTKKIIAVILGFVVSTTIGFTCIFWGQGFAILADKLSSDTTRKVFTNWEFDTTEISNFFFFYLIGLGLALGLTTTFILWDFKDSFRRRLFIYFPFLLLIMGFSTYNYSHFDYLIKPDIQVIFNLAMTFLSLVFLFQLWTLKPKLTDGIILKYFILFLLLFCGFLIPAFFSICWFIKRIGLAEFNFGFNMPIIATITGVISTTITVLKYRSDRKKEQLEIIKLKTQQ